MHPHIPRPRRKATRTCTDTASVVRTVHGEFMWPFTARVNEKTTPIERIAAIAICRRLRDARRQIYAPPSNGQRPACGFAARPVVDKGRVAVLLRTSIIAGCTTASHAARAPAKSHRGRAPCDALLGPALSSIARP